MEALNQIVLGKIQAKVQEQFKKLFCMFNLQGCLIKQVSICPVQKFLTGELAGLYRWLTAQQIAYMEIQDNPEALMIMLNGLLAVIAQADSLNADLEVGIKCRAL